ncbi:MAG TPA: RnfABCDGE type electron transport complex subunit D [Bacillota bacterium]|nr:RnfABCDGE type electron transport complex subunit D [Bacillota bacterium]HPE38642.1 RnfABCDGE type electron transport complex subunit D [Bacillota bacterium]
MIQKQLAPHIHASQNASERYLNMCVALMPCIVSAIFYYGIRAIILLAVGALSFFTSDYLFAKYLRKETMEQYDQSSFVSGILLVLMVPASTSIWALLVGILFASFFGKQCFGGVGCNVFNPALLGRAFLELFFPNQMTPVEYPGIFSLRTDTLLTGATSNVVTDQSASTIMETLSGRYSGMMGVASIVLIGLSIVYLLVRKLYKPEAPLAYLFVVVLGYFPACWGQFSFEHFLFWLTSGGFVFIAAFALSDCTTMPICKSGRIVFGVGAGILAVFLNRFTYPVLGMVFPVLMMNMITPIFDFYIRPRVFGKQQWYEKKGESV